MTIIAWDGETLAADSLSTTGYYRREYLRKIEEVPGGYAAAAGRREDLLLFVEWLRALRPHEKPKLSDEFVGFVVGSIYRPEEVTVVCTRFEQGLVGWEVSAPNAIGSGWSEALIALRCGVSAVEATLKVCDLLIDCQAPVHWVNARTGECSWTK